MLKVGQEEVDAISKVLLSGELFRYHPGGQCERFETRFARFLGVRHVGLCTSGTTALTSALSALGVGPGDEVVVPAHTYMATAISVLAAGAIPIIADIDESITLSPKALSAAIGPRTRAVIPVHMWGLVCDMDPILAIAKKRKLLVIEDACQCVCGGYKGRPAGSMGDAGAFSFNYFKNMTCGEGGAVVMNDSRAFNRAKCMIDCCSFFWTGKAGDLKPFASSGSRASELDGAMMNAQLDRVPALLKKLRAFKKLVLRRTAASGLTPNPCHSLDSECATNVMFLLPSSEQAKEFAKLAWGGVASNTGRHTYTDWDPILSHQGAAHPALDPFKMPQNKKCRKTYSKDMCPKSLDILSRTVMIGLRPEWTDKQRADLIARINAAAKTVLAGKV